MSEVLENILNIEIEPKNELAKALKATLGKPQRVFPFLVNDFSYFAYYGPDLYRYNGTHYEQITDLDIDRLTRKFYLDNGLDDKYTTSKARELKAMIKYDPRIVQEDFDNYPSLINLNNGIYDFDTKIVIPHSKDYKFTYRLNISYTPGDVKKDCPTFRRFLEGCFADSGDWDNGYVYDKDAYENIIRLCGYLLYPINRIEGLFIFIGEGSNGKSVLIDTLKLFFPAKYITYLSLNAISNEDGFMREKLIKSRINFCSEQRSGSINSEELKKVASGEGLTVQRKFNQAMDFDSHTKVCVSSNTMPYFNDTTNGILRRLFIYNFKNRFVDKKVYDAEDNPVMRRVFLAKEKSWLENAIKEEREAIFELFLGGLERLKRDGWQFVKSQNMAEILDEYKTGSDVLGTWIKENYELGDDGDFYSVSDIYNEFRLYYENNYNKRCPYSAISVGKKIKDKFRFDKSTSFTARENGKIIRNTGYPIRKRTESIAFQNLMDLGLDDKKETQKLF